MVSGGVGRRREASGAVHGRRSGLDGGARRWAGTDGDGGRRRSSGAPGNKLKGLLPFSFLATDDQLGAFLVGAEEGELMGPAALLLGPAGAAAAQVLLLWRCCCY